MTACRTCKDERKHVVVAAENGVPLRVQCLTCGANRKYRPPKPVGTKTAKKTTSRSSKKKAPKKFLDVSTLPVGEARPYAMDGIFEVGDILDHKKFGFGRIEEVFGSEGKMLVLFEDGERKLLCGKPA
ncbi:hypothetical protein [Oceanidesulfovibrio marinus]|uniref:hypothetical protein n=1 Tax=Oceanidesulfovibrio marinus TaxID=370038 RepID=UPI001184B777|nr:hypothetical protein [Oceanidesulfovibrio marinus]